MRSYGEKTQYGPLVTAVMIQLLIVMTDIIGLVMGSKFKSVRRHWLQVNHESSVKPWPGHGALDWRSTNITLHLEVV